MDTAQVKIKSHALDHQFLMPKFVIKNLPDIGITVPVTIQKGCFSRALRCCAGLAKQQSILFTGRERA
ncbi:hypothetical protein G3496_04505 [Shewanella baltica]|uniref:hypothetical protein n=1 Tax=Shewanella baltica TaxID=62322 RepID=UPI00217DD988|nr:hypothetical protein [Shewanella baltica]MCS6134188.1 hypothetical protein [Shewanella baltica]